MLKICWLFKGDMLSCKCRAIAGKCMDFVHEDMSLMSQEMDRWKALQKVKVRACNKVYSITKHAQ